MTTIHFTGKHYASIDGKTFLTWNEPGYYDVSDDKAAQLSSDFPDECAIVQEGEIVSTQPVPDTTDTVVEEPVTPDTDKTEQAQAPQKDTDTKTAKKGK